MIGASCSTSTRRDSKMDLNHFTRTYELDGLRRNTLNYL